MSSPVARIAFVALAIVVSTQAQAGPEMLEVEAPNRAKIAKAKIRISAQQRQADAQGKAAEQSTCGSQSIGNTQTSGRIGTTPREVFVFAPNAINIVGRGGCN